MDSNNNPITVHKSPSTPTSLESSSLTALCSDKARSNAPPELPLSLHSGMLCTQPSSGSKQTNADKGRRQREHRRWLRAQGLELKRHHISSGIRNQMLSSLITVPSSVNTLTLPAVSSGYTGRATSAARERLTLQGLLAQRFRVVPWQGQ